MLQEIGIIKSKTLGNINYVFCDIFGLLMFIKSNTKYKDSLKVIFTKSYYHSSLYNETISLENNKKIKLIDLVLEDYFVKENKKKIKILLFYNKNKIIGMSKIIHTKNSAFITDVYIIENCRRKNLCYRNIKFLIDIMSKKYKILTSRSNVSKYTRQPK